MTGTSFFVNADVNFSFSQDFGLFSVVLHKNLFEPLHHFYIVEIWISRIRHVEIHSNCRLPSNILCFLLIFM